MLVFRIILVCMYFFLGGSLGCNPSPRKVFLKKIQHILMLSCIIILDLLCLQRHLKTFELFSWQRPKDGIASSALFLGADGLYLLLS